MKMNDYKNVDEYLANFPDDVRAKLEKVRACIRAALPEATEKISYGIPTYWQGKNIVHFGGYPKHIGFYPGSGPIAEFAKELTDYETAKGTIKFPLDKPIPFELIDKIARYQMAQVGNKN